MGGRWAKRGNAVSLQHYLLQFTFSPDGTTELGYPSPNVLQVVDTVLLATLERTWKCMSDIARQNRRNIQPCSSALEELRSSRLGQALLFLRVEIEAWKRQREEQRQKQREQRRKTKAPEE